MHQAFNGAVKKVYNKKGFTPDMLADPKIKGLIDEIYNVLSESIHFATGEEESSELIEKLDSEAYNFSGFKTYHQMNEASGMLQQEGNSPEPFTDYLKRVKAVDAKYNENWLQTEYNLFQNTAAAAQQWEDYSKTGNRYDLQYRTAADDRVREEHAALHGTTLPFDDPFWDKYYPPNGYNCFVAGTQVLTSNGTWENIESIKKGDLLIGGSGKIKPVIGTHVNFTDCELIRITTKGRFTTCTPNHRILTSNGWTAAGDITKGDIIIQIGKVGFLNKCINAINNLYVIGCYCAMSFVRQWNPLSAHSIATMSNFNAGTNKNLSNRSIIYSPYSAQIPEAPKFMQISDYCGIDNISAFNRFNSFYDFIRKTFFHNRYVFVQHKDSIINNHGQNVYNLSIKDDESYIIKTGIVHNCRCTVVQVIKGKYKTSDSSAAIEIGNKMTEGKAKSIFRFNPGKTKKPYPSKHPYMPQGCGDCQNGLRLAYNKNNPACQACNTIHEVKIKNGIYKVKSLEDVNGDVAKLQEQLHNVSGSDYVFTLKEIIKSKTFKKVEKGIYSAIPSNSKDNEYSNLIVAARKLVSKKYDVYLQQNPKSTRSGDYILTKGNFIRSYDLKTITGKSSVLNRLTESTGQTKRWVLNITTDYNPRTLFKELKKGFESNKEAEQIIILKGNKIIYVNRDEFDEKQFRKEFTK